MNATINSTWQYLKQSIGLLLQNKRLLLAPTLLLAVLVLFSIIIGPFLLRSWQQSQLFSQHGFHLSTALGWLALLLSLALLFQALTTSLRIMVITCIAKDLADEPYAMVEQLLQSLKLFHRILWFVIIDSFIVAVINKLFKGRAVTVGLIREIADVSLELVMFFTLPIIALENQPVISSMRRAGTLVKSHWSEQLLGIFGLYVINYFFYWPAMAILVVGFWLFNQYIAWVMMIAISLILLGMLVETILYATLQTVMYQAIAKPHYETL